MGIRVKAVKMGFYGGVRRRVGQIFEIAQESHFSDAFGKDWPGWMVKVSDEEAAAATPPALPAPNYQAERISLGSRAKAAEKAPEVKAPPAAGKPAKAAEKAPTGSKAVIGE